MSVNTVGIIERAVLPDPARYNQSFTVAQNTRGCTICDELRAAAGELKDPSEKTFIGLLADHLHAYFTRSKEDKIIENEKGVPPWNMIGEEDMEDTRGSLHDELDTSPEYPMTTSTHPSPLASRATLETMDRIIGLLHY